MKVQINSISFYEEPIREWGSRTPVAIVTTVSSADCRVYLDNGDILNYTVNLLNESTMYDLVNTIKDIVIKKVSKINA